MRNDGCGWTERISAFFDGEGAAWERWRCRAHARRCGACQSWLAEVGLGWSALRAELDGPADRAFVEGVMERLEVVPAPATAADPPRAARSWPLQLVAAGAVTAVVGFVFVPLLTEHRENLQARTCQANVHQLSRAITAYAEDHDGHFPLAATWAPAAVRYVRSDDLLHCPADTTEPALPSYQFSESLSAQSVRSPSLPAAVPVVFESDAGRFTPRHDDRGHAAFLDGRVIALRALGSP